MRAPPIAVATRPSGRGGGLLSSVPSTRNWQATLFQASGRNQTKAHSPFAPIHFGPKTPNVALLLMSGAPDSLSNQANSFRNSRQGPQGSGASHQARLPSFRAVWFVTIT